MVGGVLEDVLVRMQLQKQLLSYRTLSSDCVDCYLTLSRGCVVFYLPKYIIAARVFATTSFHRRRTLTLPATAPSAAASSPITLTGRRPWTTSPARLLRVTGGSVVVVVVTVTTTPLTLAMTMVPVAGVIFVTVTQHPVTPYNSTHEVKVKVITSK